MKLTLKKELLLNELNKVNKAIDSRTPLESLTGIKLTLNEKGLELLASDSDLSIKTIMPLDELKVKENGSVLLDAKYLVEVVKNVRAEDITLEEKDSHVLLKAGKSKFKLVKMDVYTYPKIDFSIEQSKLLKVKSLDFKKAVDHTVYATSTQETRPILTGVNIKSKNNTLIATACDSYRYAKYIIPFTSEINDISFDFTLPRKSVVETSKLLGNIDEEVEILVAERCLIIRTKELLIKTRLIDGTYPDIDRLTPSIENSLMELKFNKNELLEKLENNKIVVNIAQPTTVFSIVNEKNEETGEVTNRSFYLSAQSDVGDSVEELENIDQTKIIKDNYKIAFNNNFLIETLRKLNDDEVIIYFNQCTQAFLVKPSSTNNELHLLLPYRVR